MGKQKVLVTGASGMLGSMVADVLSRDESLAVTATVRSQKLVQQMSQKAPNIDWRIFEITDKADTVEQLRQFADFKYFINAIGIIKPYARDDKPDEVLNAITVNAAFPHWLCRTLTNTRILQIATDCVYSGAKGKYIETDKHDAIDVYGKTKSLGEALLPNINHLRCSIIGPESKSHVSLLDWFKNQPEKAKLSGYTNHLWNGVTTFHFGKICAGIIKSDLPLPSAQHVIPTGFITKHDLLCCFAQNFQRGDIDISPAQAPVAIDRTLATANEQENLSLWCAAGYGNIPPTVEQMVEEMASFDYRFEGVQ